jgi:hypothetical protein
MKLSDIKHSVGAVKRLLDPTLPANPQPLDLRVAVMDDIEQQVVAVGIGERAFPYEQVVVRILARGEHAEAPLERAFADLEARIRQRFSEIKCEVAARFDVRVRVIRRVPAGWPEGHHFTVGYGAKRGNPNGQRLKLTVLEGAAAKKHYVFAPRTILIGRMREVEESRGGVRLNDIAFRESEGSVSRAHARITYNQVRKAYHLVDERSARGTRVLRNGRVMRVPADVRGMAIQDGDEIQLGGARIAISIE